MHIIRHRAVTLLKPPVRWLKIFWRLYLRTRYHRAKFISLRNTYIVVLVYYLRTMHGVLIPLWPSTICNIDYTNETTPKPLNNVRARSDESERAATAPSSSHQKVIVNMLKHILNRRDCRCIFVTSYIYNTYEYIWW